jgi:hypothetical protein
MRALMRRFGCSLTVLLAFVSVVSPLPAYAQTDEGFVYAMLQNNGAPNQVYGFAANPIAGV